jgi:diadenosine tetraphosphatase ApaH/serine/threonine PP2A family protein phosphatase
VADTDALRALLDSYVEDVDEPGWCCTKHTPQPDDVRALLAEIDALRAVRDAAEECANEVESYGESCRMDWSDLDGRDIRDAMYAATKPLWAAIHAIEGARPK